MTGRYYNFVVAALALLLATPAAAAPAPKQPPLRDNPQVRAELLSGLKLMGVAPGGIRAIGEHVYEVTGIEIVFGANDELTVAVKMRQLR